MIRTFLTASAAVASLVLVAASSAGATTTITRANAAAATPVVVTGDAASDALTVLQVGTTLTFDQDGVAVALGAAASCASNDTVAETAGPARNEVVCTVTAGMTPIIANFAGGSDTLFSASGVDLPMTVDGGPGADGVRTGSGNDLIYLDGAIGPEGESADARAGNDTIDARASVDPAATIGLGGGDGSDTIYGGAATATINGGVGSDVVYGGSGDEAIYGDEGADALYGGGGNDTIYPANDNDGNGDIDGPDTISGGPGIDRLSYEDRSEGVTVDLATAGPGGSLGEGDQIAADFESLSGGEGADTLLGSADANVIRGDRGADTIDGRGGADALYGDADADTITASGDLVQDVVDCGAFDRFGDIGGPSDVDVARLDFVDLLTAGSDCETVDRAAKPDDPVVPIVPAPVTPAPIVPAPVVDPARGTAGNDRFTGTAKADLLAGGLGNDFLSGLAGDDDLRGGTGNDELLGGIGNDELDGGAGNDKLAGDAGVDHLAGGAGNDSLNGGANADTLVGGAGKDTLDGGPGADFLMARDGVKGDTVTCTKVNLKRPAGRAERDAVVVDKGDVVKNRAYCRSVVVA